MKAEGINIVLKVVAVHTKHMRTNTEENKNGFTLVELLLYISISATVLLVVVSLLALVIKGQIKNQAITEVEQQGGVIMDIITANIRNADSVISPGAGEASDSLVLAMPDTDRDPVIFDSYNRTIRITEGQGDPVPLSNSRVLVSDLNFANLAPEDIPSSVRIEFTLEHINPEGRYEYEYKKTFTGSATVR
jgi:type II secretory pathway pseudopilin PulG